MKNGDHQKRGEETRIIISWYYENSHPGRCILKEYSMSPSLICLPVNILLLWINFPSGDMLKVLFQCSSIVREERNQPPTVVSLDGVSYYVKQSCEVNNLIKMCHTVLYAILGHLPVVRKSLGHMKVHGMMVMVMVMRGHLSRMMMVVTTESRMLYSCCRHLMVGTQHCRPGGCEPPSRMIHVFTTNH